MSVPKAPIFEDPIESNLEIRVSSPKLQNTTACDSDEEIWKFHMSRGSAQSGDGATQTDLVVNDALVSVNQNERCEVNKDDARSDNFTKVPSQYHQNMSNLKIRAPNDHISVQDWDDETDGFNDVAEVNSKHSLNENTDESLNLSSTNRQMLNVENGKVTVVGKEADGVELWSKDRMFIEGQLMRLQPWSPTFKLRRKLLWFLYGLYYLSSHGIVTALKFLNLFYLLLAREKNYVEASTYVLKTMEDDYEFTLEDENNMLLPYARDQGKTKDHEDITFLVIGSHSVHLSGFFYGESEDCFGDEYASDPYEEGAAEIDSESSDSIKFEDVAEDGDKDGSTDDAFSMYPPSPIPNSEDEDGFSLLESKRKSATSKKSDGIEDEDTHEEALNETARGTDVGERKGLQRIVSDDTSKTYDHQSRGEQIKQKKVMDGKELAGAQPSRACRGKL
ncbi:hypothetical protein CQW23_32940 [Capsicum baccatum]|uniref:Uncharacterized protein n=1 Tax=Capsicum baccatum TaxID=33114 RepID=A0A2G2V395_CAPBA|nr:hypothetical protein CQW23_32940 [Capsicum baccatum]